MIERVAREIARASALDDGKERSTANDFTDAVWEDFVPVARAVLVAMRDPTDSMIQTSSSDGGRIWRMMIDAELTVIGDHSQVAVSSARASA
jgi:hypothetical protein